MDPYHTTPPMATTIPLATANTPIDLLNAPQRSAPSAPSINTGKHQRPPRAALVLPVTTGDTTDVPPIDTQYALCSASNTLIFIFIYFYFEREFL